MHKYIGEKEFGDLCFDFGIELDDITSEYEEIKAEKGKNAPELATASKAVLYKIELPGMLFCFFLVCATDDSALCHY